MSNSKKSDALDKNPDEVLRAYEEAERAKKKKKDDPKETEAANRRMRREQEAMSGNWGATRVHVTGLAEGASKLRPHGAPTGGGERNEASSANAVYYARQRLMELYNFNWNPPECFVAQMAFTRNNGFLLTTDGRLFSWGKDGACLGRFVGQQYRNHLIDDNVKR